MLSNINVCPSDATNQAIIIKNSGLADWNNADRELCINEISVNGNIMMGVDPCRFSLDSCWTLRKKRYKAVTGAALSVSKAKRSIFIHYLLLNDAC